MPVKRILVVDSAQHTHQQVASICGRRRYSCIKAASADIGHDVLRSVRTDLVILDTDSIDARSFLVGVEGLEMPPVVCTTSVPETLHELSAPHVKLVIGKPLDGRELRKAIDRMTGSRLPMAQKATILLVEDRPGMRYVVRNALHGTTIGESSSLADAYAQLQRRFVDVLIVDRQLPEHGGSPGLVDLCRLARRSGANVVMLSAMATSKENDAELRTISDSMVGPDLLSDQALRSSIASVLRTRGFNT
jgi:DNA-binding response OmpR family regulator